MCYSIEFKFVFALVFFMIGSALIFWTVLGD